MSIALDPSLEARLRVRADAEGITIQAYVERIAREDEQAEQELETFALEGLNSGDAIKPDPAYWDDKRRRLEERYRSTAR